MHLAQTFFEEINFIFCYFCDWKSKVEIVKIENRLLGAKLFRANFSQDLNSWKVLRINEISYFNGQAEFLKVQQTCGLDFKKELLWLTRFNSLGLTFLSICSKIYIYTCIMCSICWKSGIRIRLFDGKYLWHRTFRKCD